MTTKKDTHKNEKLRVFREQSKNEHNGRGRSNRISEYEADRKNEITMRAAQKSALRRGMPKPRGTAK